MSGAPRAAVPQIDGVFVLGFDTSGIDLVNAVLSHAGLWELGGAGGGGLEPLATFADGLLDASGGSRLSPPEMAPQELARVLAPFADDARRLAADLLPPAGGRRQPWVWADPALSFLAPFWADALGVRPAVVLVHRDPGQVAAGEAAADVLDRWDRYNRSAIVVASQWPAMITNYEFLVGQPKEWMVELGTFLERLDIHVDLSLDDVVGVVEGRPDGAARSMSDADTSVASHHRVLARVMDELGGWSLEGPVRGSKGLDSLMSEVSTFYDEDYYGVSYDKSGVPYSRDQKLWSDVFAAIATAIVDSAHPKTALDVGCATGMLVEALRNRGVDAHGVDISRWAIDQIPEDLQPYCRLGSITDELEGHYDLITCSEVLEHLPPFLAEDAVANLCRHADAVLFSSTPSHFDEPTHLNVEPSGYWARLFFRQGFLRDVDYDASYLAPHAVLFRRGQMDVEEIIAEYERGLSTISSTLGAHIESAVAEHDKLAAAHNELAESTRAMDGERHQLRAEVEDLRNALTETDRRRSAEVLAAAERIRENELSQRRLAAQVHVQEVELAAIRQTKTFRYTTSLRKLYSWARRRREVVAPAPVAPVQPPDGSYQLWVEQYDTLDDAARGRISGRLSGLARRPLVSVIMPVYNPPADLLRAAVDSVLAQIYPDWELCIADDCSTEGHVAEVLDEYAARDPRIKVSRRDSNGHISAACNTALSSATGEWVTCLDQDDVLAEHALALAVLELAAHPDAGLLYSDEDKLDGAGNRTTPYFKPDFDPLLLLGQNFLNHMTVLRRDLVTAVGGYRQGYEGSQDWDLALRVTERITPDQVVHIPHVLYHWRAHAGSTASLVSAKPYAVDAGHHAVVDHLDRTGRSARVTRISASGHNRVTWALPEHEPHVTIVVPTRDGRLLQRCIDSVFSFTTYSNFEMLVVDNGSRSLPTLDYLRHSDGRLTVIRDEQPFNYSAINNAAVRRASGELICLMNDDTEVISGDWLSDMVGHVLQPGVGAVGAKLYYDDGRIQHAGVVLGILGVAGHSHRMADRLSPGYFGRLLVAQTMSAVTAACMVVRREAWDAVKGLDEASLAIAFNDVDFCLRLREAGWHIVWTPNAELFHHESVSRGPDDQGPRAVEFKREFEYIENRWGPETLRSDPYYNPNLSLVAEDFSLAWPPRVSVV